MCCAVCHVACAVSECRGVFQHWLWTDRLLREALLCSLAPLLERLQPNREVCQFLSRFCHDFPRSCLIRLRVAPVVETILKHNVVRLRSERRATAGYVMGGSKKSVFGKCNRQRVGYSTSFRQIRFQNVHPHLALFAQIWRMEFMVPDFNFDNITSI